MIRIGTEITKTLVCTAKRELPAEYNDEIEMDGDGSMDDGDVSNSNGVEC